MLYDKYERFGLQFDFTLDSTDVTTKYHKQNTITIKDVKAFCANYIKPA